MTFWNCILNGGAVSWYFFGRTTGHNDICMSVHAKLLRNTADYYGNSSITGVGKRHTPPHETTNWSLKNSLNWSICASCSFPTGRLCGEYCCRAQIFGGSGRDRSLRKDDTHKPDAKRFTHDLFGAKKRPHISGVKAKRPHIAGVGAKDPHLYRESAWRR